MAGVIESIFVFIAGVVNAFEGFLVGLPSWLNSMVKIFLLAILIAVIAIFIWKFYRY